MHVQPMLSLLRPQVQLKFRQVFRTHDKVPITYAAIELATLVQIGLFYCNLLQPQYVDGLVCNETIRGINAWWDKYGQIRHHTKPKENVMFGPMSVAAITLTPAVNPTMAATDMGPNITFSLGFV